MVDALCRARRWVQPPLGCVIDLRPADVAADVEIGLADGSTVGVGGLVVDAERQARHAAAEAALSYVLTERVLTLEDEDQFWFLRYPSTIDELRDYIATTWQHTRLDAATYARAVELQRANPGARLWLRERVAIRRLRPSV